MTEKNKKRAIIAAMIGAFIVIVWWLAHKKTVAPSVAATAPDAQDGYYTGYNMPPITLPGTASVQPSHIDLGNVSNNFGVGQDQLDALGDRICGCMNKCDTPKPFTGNLFDTSLIIPELPPYLSNYVAPVVGDLNVASVPAPSVAAITQAMEPVDKSYLIYKNNPYNPDIQTDEVFRQEAKRNNDALDLQRMNWAI